MNDDRLEQIFKEIAEVHNDVKHLTSRMDTRAAEIEKLTEKLHALDVRLSVNDRQTARSAGWFDYMFKGLVTLFAGFVAMRIGLK